MDQDRKAETTVGMAGCIKQLQVVVDAELANGADPMSVMAACTKVTAHAAKAADHEIVRQIGAALEGQEPEDQARLLKAAAILLDIRVS